jgi:hypothetical protein
MNTNRNVKIDYKREALLIDLKNWIHCYIQSFVSGEQEEVRSSCAQRIFWSPGTAF